MLVHKWNHLRSLALVLFLGCNSVLAKTELEPAGLAVYTETARDIYIAALLLPTDAGLDNVLLAPGPKAMEYRISTRRISIRGFSGMLLLQAELGSSSRAPESALNALAALKGLIKGALKQGDQFVIALSETDETIFYLNNHELLKVPEGDVFDFFFAGWVGENSSAMLHEPLLAGTINPAVLARYTDTQPAAERIELVVAWTEPPPAPEPKPKPTPKPAPKPAAKPDPRPAPEAVVKEPSAKTMVASAAASSTPAPAGESTGKQAVEDSQVAESSTSAALAAAPNTAAAAAAKPGPPPSDSLARVTTPDQPIAEEAVAVAATPASAELQLDDREYQVQLNNYVTVVMNSVFREVKYPRRAVDKSQEGKVELLAYFDANGELLDVVTDSSSGYTTLDKAAHRAVKNAGPFPALSQVAREEFVNEDGDNFVMPIPITFRLQ